MKNLPPPFVVGETYLDREGEYVVVSVAGDRVKYERADGRQLEDATEIKARIHRNMLLELGDYRSFRGRRITFDGRRPVGFTHSEAFPLVAAAIRSHSKSYQEFVTHERLVSALVEHPELRLVLEQLEEHDPQQKPAAWWASNMVAWFSQVFTVGRSDWESQFVRRKEGGSWAYAVRAKA